MTFQNIVLHLTHVSEYYRNASNTEHFQFEPEVEERIIEIPKLVEQVVVKEVVIPETHIVEVVKEIPQVQEVILCS